MHPTSADWRTWRAKKLTWDGYYARRWYEGTRREGRKLREQREHRWVWEQVHGVKVPAGYEVHHRNEIRTDNAPENLEAIPKPDHDRLHGDARRVTTCKCGAPAEYRTQCRACHNAYSRALRVRHGGRNRPERAYGCQCAAPRAHPQYGWCIDCSNAWKRAKYAEARGGIVRHYRPRRDRAGEQGA